MNITTLGIDLAKDVFQLHGIDKEATTILKVTDTLITNFLLPH